MISTGYKYAFDLNSQVSWLCKGESWLIAKISGTVIILPKAIRIAECSGRGWQRLCATERRVFVNEKGLEAVPCIYDSSSFYFEDGFIAVRKKRHPFLRRPGTLVIPPLFDRCGNFQEGFAYLGTNNSSSLYNRNGECVF